MTNWIRLVIIIARLAMVLSIFYYTATLAFIWATSIAGDGNALFEFLGLPEITTLPALWRLGFGVAVSIFTLSSLAAAYWSVHRFFGSFNHLEYLAGNTARTIKRLAIGLVGFWLGYNLLTGAVPLILTYEIAPDFYASFEWDPLDIDIIILILGITLYAVSLVLERAQEIDGENRQFF